MMSTDEAQIDETWCTFAAVHCDVDNSHQSWSASSGRCLGGQLSVVESVGPRLRALTDRLWIPDHSSESPVRVGYGRPASGTTTIEEYVAVPNLRSPKLLVPVGAPAACRAAFGRHLATSSMSTRARSAGLLAAFGTPVGERLMRQRLFVGIDSSIDPSDWPTWNLLQHLRTTLDAANVVAFIQMRRVTPNAKPTLRLFESGGTAIGFAKVGWSDATREVVRNEAAALSAVQDRLQLLQVPRLADSGVWQGQEYAVAAPLPPGVRAYSQEPSTAPELLLDIARAGDVTRGPLRSSAYASHIAADLEQAAGAEPEASAVLLGWLDRLKSQNVDLDYGRWHGDFVPWNLGRTGKGVVAWDWEYSEPGVPVGFDLVHWHFQRRIAAADGTLADAVRTADGEAARLLTLGVDPTACGLVTSLYLLTMFTRAVRLAAGGAGWNPKFYPDFLDVARTRDV